MRDEAGCSPWAVNPIIEWMGTLESITATASGSRRPTAAPHGPEKDDGTDAPQCLVVMYHYVHDRSPTLELGPAGERGGVRGLTSREFETQIDTLSRTMEPIDWPTLYGWTQGRKSIPRRCFLLTFDDGLADHANVVAPILKRRGLRGVFFVPGVVVTSRRLLSGHAIHVLLSRLGDEGLQRELTAYLSDHAPSAYDESQIDWRAAESMYHYEPPVRARLKYLLTVVLPIEVRNAAVDALFERHVGSAARWSKRWYLGWDDLVAMQASGHTLGVHGFSHEPLTRLTPAQCRDDIARAAGVLRSGLGPDIRPFSYPYGRFDDATVAACREAGFAHAFTTEERWLSDKAESLRFPRVDTIHVDSYVQADPSCASE